MGRHRTYTLLNLPAVIWIIMLLVAPGCSRSQPEAFSMSEKVRSLPPLHQEQIETTLIRFFGTAANPKMMVLDENADPEAESLDLVSALDTGRLRRGAAVYNVRCSGCHGVTGDGQGEAAAYLQPKPRDYRRGVFKFTSTPFGAKPARIDLVRTIRRGAKGTSMPAFPWMDDEDLDAVIDYVILLSQRGEVEERVARMAEFDYDEDEEIAAIEFLDGIAQVRSFWERADLQIVQPVTPRPPFDRASILAGREIFVTDNCWKCHGKDGKGQTDWLSHEFIAAQEALPESQQIQINRDAWGEPAPAADITARMLHGGRRPIDVYRRIYTGINGTPMPAFAQTFADDPDKIWHLVHYVLSIVEGGDADPAADPATTQNGRLEARRAHEMQTAHRVP